MRNGAVRGFLGPMVWFAGSLASMAACVAADGGGGDGGGGGGGGWTAMPLLDEVLSPDRTIYRKGNDLVSGIYYESATRGVIVSQGADGTFSHGGAVFEATGSAVTSIAFGGDNTGLRLIGGIDFIGLEHTPSGYVAMAYASDVIASRDGGATFQIQHNGSADRFGIEAVLAYQLSSSGTTLVRKSGVVTVSSGTPGPDASYEDIWAPNATAPIPDPVPASQCQGAPLGTGRPTTRYSVHVSADREVIAYTSNPDHQPELCLSSDGGRSFFPHVLDVPASATDFTPTGVVFTSRMVGLTWFAQPSAGVYVKRTDDGGVTWRDVALPSEIAAGELELPAGFFAPDGQHGWLAGFDHAARRALLLVTSDGGATWAKVPGIGDAVDAAGGDKLYSGFALDAAHVWIGGSHGVVMHN
jgi:hypothetical protein